jgi:very-short-patch-repair endonuclease
MINLIKVNGLEIVDDTRIGKKHIFTLIDKTELLRQDIKQVEIQCQTCQKFYQRKLSHAHLIKKYQCNSCHSTLNNPFKGKKHSVEFKEKLSKDRKGKRLNPHSKSTYQWWLEKYGKEEADKRQSIANEKCREASTGEKNGFYGKTHTNEVIQTIIKKTKATNSLKTEEQKKETSNKLKLAHLKQKSENNEQYIKNRQKAGKISTQCQSKYKMNKIEKLVQDELKKLNIKFEYSVILGNYQFDFGNKEKRILIEVQGDYWHGNKKLYQYLNHVQACNVQRDKLKEQFAIDNKFKLITIWEQDILNNNFTNFLAEIKEFT